MYKRFYYLGILLLVFYSNVFAQHQYQYINSQANCLDINYQCLVSNDSIYLININQCDTQYATANILMKGLNYENIGWHYYDTIQSILNSSFESSGSIYTAGVSINSRHFLKPHLVLNKLDVKSSNLVSNTLDLFSDTIRREIFIRGIAGNDSIQVVYGDFREVDSNKVGGLLIWLKDFEFLESIIFLKDNEWTSVKDAKISTMGDFIILTEIRNRVGLFWEAKREFEVYSKLGLNKNIWTSPVINTSEVLACFDLLNDSIIVFSNVANPNDNRCAITSINTNGEVQWHTELTEAGSNEQYTIFDIKADTLGNIFISGYYENFNENIVRTGFIAKFNSSGQLYWHRIFLDSTLSEPFNRSIEISSINFLSNSRIVTTGVVLKNIFTMNENLDIYFSVLDSLGCIQRDCGRIQNITPIESYVDSSFIWTEVNSLSFNPNNSLKFTFSSDYTILSEKAYTELLYEDSFDGKSWKPTNMFFRYDSSKVYINVDSVDYIFYDFSLTVNDTFHFYNPYFPSGDYIVEGIDSIVLLNGELKKRFHLKAILSNGSYSIYWLENFGNLKGFLSVGDPFFADFEETDVLCIYYNEMQVYMYPSADSCWYNSYTSLMDEDKDEINIFPIPFSSNLFIDVESLDYMNHDCLYLQIYDATGRLCLNREVLVNETLINISTTMFSPGLYYLLFICDNVIVSKPILKL